MNSAGSRPSLSKPHQKGISPKYPSLRVSTVEALCSALNQTPEALYTLANQSETYYVLKERKLKPDGTSREIFNVREPLKSVQKAINRRFLKRCIYPVYLTGSLPKCDYILNAQRHAGQATVIAIDACNFFPNISDSLVFAVWKKLLGFDDEVSRLLTSLCTYQGFLAQGAPASSYLANLAFWDIEPLIYRELLESGFRYTRYVDDIIVSHSQRLDKTQKIKAIQTAQKVFLSKGLACKTRKTKVMDRNRRQVVNNLIVNSKRATGGKKRKGELRAAVHQFIKACSAKTEAIEELRIRYRSIRGRVIHYRRLNNTAGQKLLEQLAEHWPE